MTGASLPWRGIVVRSGWIAALLTCTLGCTGGGSAGPPREAPHDGPLALGGGQGTLCLPVGPSGDYTYAFDGVKNTTESAIGVRQIRLVGADHAALVDAYLAPIIDQNLIGVMPGWPPDTGPMTAFNSKRALPTQVAAHEWANLVLHIRARAPGTVQAVEVVYVSQGSAMRVRNSTTLQFRTKCS